MFDRTEKVIEQLKSADWFSAVGEKLEADAVFLSSWEAATQNCASTEWESVHWQARSPMFEVVDVKAKAMKGNSPRNWNKIYFGIKELLKPTIAAKTKTVAEKHGLPKIVIAQIEWDICHYAAYVDYSDVYTSTFYQRLGEFYLAGHFPCGWDGKYPEGKFIVF